MRGLGTYVFKCQSFVGSKESNEAIAYRGSAHSGNCEVVLSFHQFCQRALDWEIDNAVMLLLEIGNVK